VQRARQPLQNYKGCVNRGGDPKRQRSVPGESAKRSPGGRQSGTSPCGRPTFLVSSPATSAGGYPPEKIRQGTPRELHESLRVVNALHSVAPPLLQHRPSGSRAKPCIKNPMGGRYKEGATALRAYLALMTTALPPNAPASSWCTEPVTYGMSDLTLKSPLTRGMVHKSCV